MGEGDTEMRIRPKRRGSILGEMVQGRSGVLQVYAGLEATGSRFPRRWGVRGREQERQQTGDAAGTGEQSKRFVSGGFSICSVSPTPRSLYVRAPVTMAACFPSVIVVRGHTTVSDRSASGMREYSGEPCARIECRELVDREAAKL